MILDPETAVLRTKGHERGREVRAWLREEKDLGNVPWEILTGRPRGVGWDGGQQDDRKLSGTGMSCRQRAGSHGSQSFLSGRVVGSRKLTSKLIKFTFIPHHLCQARGWGGVVFCLAPSRLGWLKHAVSSPVNDHSIIVRYREAGKGGWAHRKLKKPLGEPQ